MGRQKASLLEEDFLDSDKALCGLPLARFGLTLPSPRPPCCSGGRQRGTQAGVRTGRLEDSLPPSWDPLSWWGVSLEKTSDSVSSLLPFYGDRTWSSE